MLKHVTLKRFGGGVYGPRPKRFGGNFIQWLEGAGRWLQSHLKPVIDRIAPITSSLVGPAISAATGIKGIPNPVDVLDKGLTTLMPLFTAIASKNQDNPNLPTKVQDLMRAQLQKGAGLKH